jgi:hypothetical protein
MATATVIGIPAIINPAGEPASFTINSAEPTTIPIVDLNRDPALMCRAAGLNKNTVREYAEAMTAGASFPPVIIFQDGKGAKWLADGFHRCAAAELAGLLEVAADVRQGSRRDALLYAASANASHGRPRSNADRRHAVLLLLNDAAWAKRSDNWLAKHAAVSQPFVSKLRATSNVISDPVRETADGREMDTAAIGRADTTDAVVARLSKALGRIVAAWPAGRRSELLELVTGAAGGGV